ncbi:hypothetical protein AB0I28_33855 [Phytomonospora sp. NPDC050363]|uniref:hypothetical protein n=1 Tax=Phytomonospora sp. NPDC050363 TaxID=3155642 RepID=UPI00340F5906
MPADPARRTSTDAYGTLRPAASEGPPAIDDDYVDESAVWSPPKRAVPPVLGRYERDTGKPLMRYDDQVDEGREEGKGKSKDDFDDGWQDDNGSAIDISF